MKSITSMLGLAALLLTSVVALAQGSGAIPTITPNISYPVQAFTATGQYSAPLGLSGLRSGLIQVSLPPLVSPVVNPTPTASTTSAGSIATWLFANAADSFTGNLVVQVGTTGAPIKVPLNVSANGQTGPSPVTSVATLVAYLNSIPAISAASVTATQGTGDNTNNLILTGPQDASVNGTNTLIVSSSAIIDTTATWQKTVTPVYVAPTSGPTSATLTYTLNAATDTLGGSLTLKVTSSGVPFTIQLPANSTITTAVTFLNANTTFATTNSLVASASTTNLIITGASGAANTITYTGSVVYDYNTAFAMTFAAQGSTDGGYTWFALPTAAYPSTTVPISTTALTQSPTAGTWYTVSLQGITRVRFLTSSTFTGSTINLQLNASSLAGYL